jgi:hypothetical protein
LRVVVIKCGASWVGSLADFLDFRVDDSKAQAMFSAQPYGETKLSLKPSEYFARNVRVTPYNFEQVDNWMQHYPHLQDVYCYSSHFPDHTGGGESLKTFYEMIAPLGDKAVEKFFCTNAAAIIP